MYITITLPTFVVFFYLVIILLNFDVIGKLFRIFCSKIYCNYAFFCTELKKADLPQRTTATNYLIVNNNNNKTKCGNLQADIPVYCVTINPDKCLL